MDTIHHVCPPWEERTPFECQPEKEEPANYMNSKSFVESKQKKKEKHENIKTAKRIYKSLQKYKTKTMFEEKKARNHIPLHVVPLGCSGGQ